MTWWLTCPKCTFRIGEDEHDREAYDVLWFHVFKQHTTGTGRDRNNSAAAIMQRHRKVDS